MEQEKGTYVKRKTVIIYRLGDDVECWGNFRKLCEAKGLVYNTLSKLPFPIKVFVKVDDETLKEATIYKVPFN